MQTEQDLSRTRRTMSLSSMVVLATLVAMPILGGVLYFKGDDGCSSCLVAASTSTSPPSANQSEWSKYSAEWLDGSSFDMSRLIGQPTILYFWATWCPLCPHQREVLQKVSSEKGIRVVGFSLDEDPEALKHYLGHHKALTHELLATPRLIEHFEIEALPTLVIIDSVGRVEKISSGLMPADDLRRIVTPLMR